MNTKPLFAAGLLGFVLILSSNVQAQERLCDPAFEDCRAPLWSLIDGETVGIDVAFWFMQDTSFATKIIDRYKAGVPVRIGNRRNINPNHSPMHLGAQRIAYTFAHRIVANSQAAAARLRREGIIS